MKRTNHYRTEPLLDEVQLSSHGCVMLLKPFPHGYERILSPVHLGDSLFWNGQEISDRLANEWSKKIRSSL